MDGGDDPVTHEGPGMGRRARLTAMEWFGRDGRVGPTLLVGLVVLSAFGWLFGETVEAVIKQDDLATLDSPVTGWLVAHRVAWLTVAMRIVTQLGSAWFVILLLSMVTAAVLARHAGRTLAATGPVSAAGAALLVTTVKLLIARPRPTVGDVVAVASGFSFPSGHSAQAVATYGALAWIATHTIMRSGRWRAWVAACVIALLIGFSRLYLGVHWLSDVVGGLVLGAAWLALTITTLTTGRRLRTGDSARRRAP
jgi:membrane-associated phospholipid phosphatase